MPWKFGRNTTTNPDTKYPPKFIISTCKTQTETQVLFPISKDLSQACPYALTEHYA